MNLFPRAHSPRGFTLIELLVVIAIIGMLSSIVVSSLNVARARGRDAAVREQAGQLRTIMGYEMADTGSYTAIKTGGGWWSANATCSGMTGNYATKGHEVCTSLVAATGGTCGSNCVYFNTTTVDATNKFTIMAYLPGASAAAGAARYLCYGSSGRTSVSSGSPWSEGGCTGNP